MGGGAVLYPHSLLHLPIFSSLSRQKFGNPKPFLPVKELTDGPSISSIRADRNGKRRQKNASARAPKAEGLEDDPQSLDGRSSLPPNKEKILALFKRIQASISKGETLNSTKRNSKIADDKASAEAIFEVLHQSTTRGKGKTSAKKVAKSLVTRKDLPLKEEGTVHSPTGSLKSTRPPSSFTRRSPIPSLLNPRDKAELENDALPAVLAPSIPRDEIPQKPDALPETDNSNVQAFDEFKEMNLAQLKEVAKSNRIRGYSKLKKSELVELLTRSLNNTSP